MKEVWFISHGESEGSASSPKTGRDAIPLTKIGNEQAEDLANYIVDKPDLVIMTPYLRTLQTANPILRKFPDVPTAILPLHEFRFFSSYENHADRDQEYNGSIENFWNRCDAHYCQGLDTESFVSFNKRVISAVKELQHCKEDFILVFAHSYAIRAIWQYFLTKTDIVDNQSMQYFRDKMGRLQIQNTAIFKSVYIRDMWTAIDPVFDPEPSQTVIFS